MEKTSESKNVVKLDGVIQACSLSQHEDGYLVGMWVRIHEKDAEGKDMAMDYPVTVHGVGKEMEDYFRRADELTRGEGSIEEYMDKCSVSVVGRPVMHGRDMIISASADNVRLRDRNTPQRAGIRLSGEVDSVSKRDRMATVSVSMDGGAMQVSYLRDEGAAWKAVTDGRVRKDDTVVVEGWLQNHLLNSDNGRISRFTVVGRKFEDISLTRRLTEERKAARNVGPKVK